ncbi:MAG: tetratricopeptide repeat protein [Vicinamibacterales bacterium]
MVESFRIQELRRRVQLDPASIAFAALAEEYRRIGHFDEAVATCRAGLQRHPAYLSARVTLGRALLEMGHYEDARTELEQVVRLAPENLAAIRGLAEIHTRLRERSGDQDPGPGLPDTDQEAPAAPAEATESDPPAATPAVSDRVPIRPLPLSVLAPPPDQAALRALETFLAAIQRARRVAPAPSGRVRSSTDR